MYENQLVMYVVAGLIGGALLCLPSIGVVKYIQLFDHKRYIPTRKTVIDWVLPFFLCLVGIVIGLLALEEAMTYTPPPKNNLIILDIDGVLNHNRTKHRQKNGLIGWSEACVAQFNRITQDNPNTSIVICSAWRIGHTLEDMQALGKEMGIEAPIIGITPSFNHDRPRDDEITAWLQEAKGTWDGMLVIDDDSSERFSRIQIKPNWEAGGLIDIQADRAIRMLKKGLPENFDIGRLESTCKSEIKKEMSFGGQRVPTTLSSE
jgi:hypothetical protein